LSLADEVGHVVHGFGDNTERRIAMGSMVEKVRQLEADLVEAVALLRIQDVENDWGAARRAFLARIDARKARGA
jgi:ribosomal protein L19